MPDPKIPAEAVEEMAEALWIENERWHRRNPKLAKEYIFPYGRLVDTTKEDLRAYARCSLATATPHILRAIAEDPEVIERGARAFYEDRVLRAWSYDATDAIKDKYRKSMQIALRAALGLEENVPPANTSASEAGTAGLPGTPEHAARMWEDRDA